MVYAERTHHIKISSQSSFMSVVRTIGDYLCPRSPGAQSFETGGYCFFNQTMTHVKHYVEPASGKPANRVRAVNLTTRASKETVQEIKAALSGKR